MMAPIKDLTRTEKQAVSFVRADGPHQRPEALEKMGRGTVGRRSSGDFVTQICNLWLLLQPFYTKYSPYLYSN